MKKYSYRITVEQLCDGCDAAQARELIFEAESHDDIIAIAEREIKGGDLTVNEAASFAVGFKLFSEVMLSHRENALFASFQPQFSEFMKELKKMKLQMKS